MFQSTYGERYQNIRLPTLEIVSKNLDPAKELNNIKKGTVKEIDADLNDVDHEEIKVLNYLLFRKSENTFPFFLDRTKTSIYSIAYTENYIT